MSNVLWNEFNALLPPGVVKLPLVVAAFKVGTATYEDRIKLMMELWRTVKYKPRHLFLGAKSPESASAFRLKGNELYISGSSTKETYYKIFVLYSKSIANASVGSEDQALAFGNRSAVLYKMKKYVECLLDIERAIGLNYPDSLRSKLYLRKIECLAALKNSVLDDAIEEARCWMKRISIDESNCIKLCDKINELVKEVPEEDNQSHLLEPVHIPGSMESGGSTPIPVIEKPNPKIPCASDAVAIEYSEQYGRHVVATRNIEPGEILAVEKPYAMLLNPSNVWTHCFHCLEVCWSIIPCNSCSNAMYCSETCKEADWEASHDIECPLFPYLITCGYTTLHMMSIRLTLLAVRRSGGVQNLMKIMKEVDNHTDMCTKGFSNGLYHSDQYRSVYSLVTNTTKSSDIELLQWAFEASTIAYFISLCPDQTLLDDTNGDAILFIGGLILRHQEMIPTNAHYSLEAGDMNFRHRGTIVMAFLSLLNHSCDSNIHQTDKFGHVILRALYPIKKGRQVLFCYGQNYARSPKTERQKHLLTQYHFFCDCVPCREDWPLYQDIKSYKVLVASSAKRRTISKAMSKFYHHLKHVAEDFDPSRAIKELLHMVRVLYDNTPLPCREMYNIIEGIRRFYAHGGNRFDLPEV